MFIQPLPRIGYCNTAVLLVRKLATDCLPRDFLRGNSFSISLPSNGYKHSSYCSARLREKMFTVPMPSYTRYSILDLSIPCLETSCITVLLLRACMERTLPSIDCSLYSHRLATDLDATLCIVFIIYTSRCFILCW
jgi:hypothetical protein